MALKDFLAVINQTDVQRSNRYVVEIQPPTIPALGLRPQEQINLMCQDVTFPGQNMRTATDDLRQGPTRDIAQAVTYGNTNMTFICTPGLPEKLFFEAWQGLMFNRTTWQARFYNDYIGRIKLRTLDRTDLVRYGIILYEVYPKIINAQDYSNTASDTIQTLQVEFAFHHWAMDTDLYSSSDEFYGSRNEDEGKPKPKRKKLAGTENMSDAEVLAFIRGDIKNEMGQSYDEAMSAAGASPGISSLLASTASATVPALTVENPVMASLLGGGKFGMLQTTIKAQAHPQAKVSPSGGGSLMSSMMSIMSGLAANAAKPKAQPMGPMEYHTAVESGESGEVKELKLPAAATSSLASAWVDPNTGKRVSSTGTGSGNGLGMIGGCFGAAPAAVTTSPAMATTMSGALTSAKGLSHATGSMDAIAGIRQQAVKNIGGSVANVSGLMSGIAANVSMARGAAALTGNKFSLTGAVSGMGLNMLSVSTIMANADRLGGKASFGVDRSEDR